MSRFHIHIAVDDLDKNIQFYSVLFGCEPAKHETDYAKWVLDDPKINFAISTRGRATGVDHVGIQADDESELGSIRDRLEAAGIKGITEEATTCCYAQSDKYWIQDPQGVAWESFHTLGDAPVFGESLDEKTSSEGCCTPKFSGSCC